MLISYILFEFLVQVMNKIIFHIEKFICLIKFKLSSQKIKILLRYEIKNKNNLRIKNNLFIVKKREQFI